MSRKRERLRELEKIQAEHAQRLAAAEARGARKERARCAKILNLMWGDYRNAGTGRLEITDQQLALAPALGPLRDILKAEPEGDDG